VHQATTMTELLAAPPERDSLPVPIQLMVPEGPRILGISADYHDSAAALTAGSVVVGAAAEERFSRRKHDAELPVGAIRWLVEAADLQGDALDAVAFYSKPLATLERVVSAHARAGFRGVPSLAHALATWGRRKIWVAYRIERYLRELGIRMPEMLFAEHHQSHAAAAFYPSPFESAAVLTFDGVGEWATSTVGHGTPDGIRLLRELRFPDSVGLLYSAMTAYCGFAVNDGEYKLMGLAPYGRPRYASVLREHVVHVHDDGSIQLDQRWFRLFGGSSMVHPRLAKLLDGPPRSAGEPLTEREADIAASVQQILEDIVLRAARFAHQLTNERFACLAGGVALNCVANRRLLEDGPFEDYWIQPAAGDDGGALGAALWAAHDVRGAPRTICPSDGMRGAMLGPAFRTEDIAAWLSARGRDAVVFPVLSDLHEVVARHLAAGRVVGWFRDRMEFGPRALGNRSILADPRAAATISQLNLRVKGREGFRPFAPAVAAEHAAQWFHLDRSAPYMLVTSAVRTSTLPQDDETLGFTERLVINRSPIGACTHVDGSARVQTVDAEQHPGFHGLLGAFAAITGVPVLLNTSFNVRDEPIVCTPADALGCAERAGLDILVLQDCVLEMSETATGS
jgi:carbamoyltransferase